jgi:hypothetical protein
MTSKVVYADAPASNMVLALKRSDFYAVDFPQQPLSEFLSCAPLDTNRIITSREGFLSNRIRVYYTAKVVKIQIRMPYIPRPKGRGFTALFR